MDDRLTQLDDNLWVVARPLRFVGLHIGTRMAIVRLSGGGLFVHSPVALTNELRGEVDALGQVQHVVAPNYYHHLYVGDFAEAYPDAMIHGVPGLANKRKKVRFDAELGEEPHPDWAGDLEQLPLAGTMLKETVFFHRASRTLVSCDVTENFETSPKWFTRMYLKVGGVHGKPGLNKLIRWVVRDKQAARASIDRILEWDFERVSVAHGDIIESDGREAVRQTYEFLG